jgi:hypothetical protein
MSPLPNPVTNKVILKQTWSPMDPDAATYIAAVEQADQQALEEKVKIAIDDFVLGCKADGIWDAIKASCILAGARTLTGALIPLKGTAPTSFNFVSGDYNRKTGLVGDGSSKYLDSNRANNADPQDSKHIGVYANTIGTPNRAYLATDGIVNGGSQLFHSGTGLLSSRCNDSVSTPSNTVTTGFLGASRESSSSYTARTGRSSSTIVSTSATPANLNLLVFRRGSDELAYTNARLAFYSIGESLDLAKLDGRVTDLINAYGRVIP